MCCSRDSVAIDGNKYLRLSGGVSIKALETNYLYDKRTDELYEISDEAMDFLVECDGSKKASELCFNSEFVEYCFEEKLLEQLDSPAPRMIDIYRAPAPSLRYLEIQITHRCNRKCRHCYLGDVAPVDLPAEKVIEAISQFEKMGGLRALISGGEPLMHPEWDLINSELSRFELRFALLTNGELITPESARKLAVQEVQVSIDGMEKGHNLIRGAGAWKKAMTGAANALEAGLDLSVATMIHNGNLDEFDEMKELFGRMGIREWGIDAMCASGRLNENGDLIPPVEKAAPLMGYAFGGSYHGGGEGFACGLHLATLTPTGELLKCGFYPEKPLGRLKEGLQTAWNRSKPIPLSELECAKCEYIAECAGGCRYRAPNLNAPDPVMCALYQPAKK